MVSGDFEDLRMRKLPKRVYKPQKQSKKWALFSGVDKKLHTV
jgi:hypothetical protein